MCTTKRYHLTTIFGVTPYDTLLFKSGLAQQLLPYAQQNESYGRAALASYVVRVYKQAWSMSEWHFMNE